MTKRIDYLSNRTKDNVRRYFKKIFDILMTPEMGILPGQLAFFMLLSAVPILSLIGYGISFFNVSSDSILNVINSVVPGGVKYLSPLVKGITMDIKLVLLLVWMFYIASNGFNSVILTANSIYGTQQSTWFKRRVKAMFMTVVFVLMLCIILIIPVFGKNILNLLSFGNMTDKVNVIFEYVKGPIMWLILFIFIRTIYEFAPDRIRKKTHVNTGALFTTIGWIIVSAVYSRLSQLGTDYSMLYGALANIAFLMIWLYFMSFVFVIGMSLNYGEEMDQAIKDKTGAVKVVKG